MGAGPGLDHLDASDGDHRVGDPGLLGVHWQVAEEVAGGQCLGGRRYRALAEGQAEGRGEKAGLWRNQLWSTASLLQGEQEHQGYLNSLNLCTLCRFHCSF